MKNAYDLALEFVTEQSCGEWSDKDIREDASQLSDLICADREAAKQASPNLIALFRVNARLRLALSDARLQIDYLHQKFAETGSGNCVLARIDAVLFETESA